MTNKLLIEFLGTYFLILTIALTGNPLAIGAVLVALVYMGGYISGAHFNPAVSLGMLVLHKIKIKQAISYICVQLLGGIGATISYTMVTGKWFVPQMSAEVAYFSSFFIEFILTFLLVSVILHVAVSAKTKGNSYYGAAIGLTVIAIAYAGGPVSGGVFNPAVGFGPLMFDWAHMSTNFANLLMYLLAPSLGGVAAALVFKRIDI